MNPVQVIALAGARGGSGKTNVAVNLALALAGLGRRTMILDADLAMANVHQLLGLLPRQTLADVLRGHCSIEQVVMQLSGGISILPGSCGDVGMSRLSLAQQAGLIHAVSDMQAAPDVLIVDTASGIAESTLNFIHASRHVLVVVRDEPASIKGAYSLIKLLNCNYGISRFHILASMTNNYHEGRALFTKLLKITDSALNVVLEYLGDIPFDENVRYATQKCRTVLDAYPTSKSSNAYKKIANRIDNWPLPENPTSHIEFFGERLFYPRSTRLAS
ncbi:flagellar number regulator FleN [Stutzerimonas stutzeri TS44]|nr:flagellar number regulator FleN [Stutzerimonas stutzeri TS44]